MRKSKGRKLNEEWKENIRQGILKSKRVYLPRSEETKRKISETLKKKPISEGLKKGWQLAREKIGEKHPRWTGKYPRKERNIAMGRIEYKNWRKDIFLRDSWTCQKCFQKGGSLEVHHIFSWETNTTLRYRIDNGITFCKKCHNLFHKIFGFRNNNKEQLEEYLSIN